MNRFEVRNIDLNKVPGSDFIEFLRIEIPQRKGYAPARFARVRYALNGDSNEQENGLPMDLGKGIFTATLEDEELGEISREELEQTLQKAAVEIIKIVRKELGKEPDILGILKSILKDYAYLKYDELYSKPPDVLKCRVINVESSRQVEDIFDIANRLRNATSENYIVAYGGSSNDDANFDKVWTRFSLRKVDFRDTKSNGA